jgi:hypothetical protein
MMANKYYVLEPNEWAAPENGKYEDRGIFSLSPEYSKIDFFKETCIENTKLEITAKKEEITKLRKNIAYLRLHAFTQDQIRSKKSEIGKLEGQILELEGKKYDTKEQRQITLKELFRTIDDVRVENVVFVDGSCFQHTLHDSLKKNGLRRVEAHEFPKINALFREVDKETGFIIPYGGKKKRRKTKIRKPKRRKTKGKTHKKNKKLSNSKHLIP